MLLSISQEIASSVPHPPLHRSFPSPPSRKSFPRPPTSLSLPAHPIKQSLPPFPFRISPLSPAINRSAPQVPSRIDLGLPLLLITLLQCSLSIGKPQKSCVGGDPSKRYAEPAEGIPVLSLDALTSMSPLVVDATDVPKLSFTSGVGLLIVSSRLPVVPSNRYAEPATPLSIIIEHINTGVSKLRKI